MARVDEYWQTDRHVVWAFGVMPVQLLSVRPRLRYELVEGIAHVRPHVRIPILIQAQSAAGMLHEEIEQANFVRLDLRKGRNDDVGYEV